MGLLCCLSCLPCWANKADEYERNYAEARGRCDLFDANYWKIRQIDEQHRRAPYTYETGMEGLFEIRFDPGIKMDERVLPYLKEWTSMFARAHMYNTVCTAYWLQSLVLCRAGRTAEALEAADMAARSAALNLEPKTAKQLIKDGMRRKDAEQVAAFEEARWRPRIEAFAASHADMLSTVKAARRDDPDHDCFGRPLADPVGPV